MFQPSWLCRWCPFERVSCDIAFLGFVLGGTCESGERISSPRCCRGEPFLDDPARPTATDPAPVQMRVSLACTSRR